MFDGKSNTCVRYFTFLLLGLTNISPDFRNVGLAFKGAWLNDTFPMIMFTR